MQAPLCAAVSVGGDDRVAWDGDVLVHRGLLCLGDHCVGVDLDFCREPVIPVDCAPGAKGEQRNASRGYGQTFEGHVFYNGGKDVVFYAYVTNDCGGRGNGKLPGNGQVMAFPVFQAQALLTSFFFAFDSANGANHLVGVAGI